MRLHAALAIVLLGCAVPRDSWAAPCTDADGDGWTDCDGDCCDGPDACGGVAAAAINPGAFDIAGNAVDDDCNALTGDTGADPCDPVLPSTASDPLDYARALDLCSFTVESPPLADRRWGVISGAFTLADGTGTPAATSRSVRSSFGSGAYPQGGAKLAVLSSGRAAAQGQTNPNWVNPQRPGADQGTSSPVPADWLAANGGQLPTREGCPTAFAFAYDPILLKLRIRVPTNAQSFRVKGYLYTSDYPEYVCSGPADFFLVLLDSELASVHREYATPRDKNLAVFDDGPTRPARRRQTLPVTGDLAWGNTGLFRQCKNGPTGCGFGGVQGTNNTCIGTFELTGTGFDLANPLAQQDSEPGYCGASNFLGGGTGWFTVRGNVEPGETIELRFVIWDTGDHLYDSVALIDAFEWSTKLVKPGAQP
jgi:hypothetical protein